MITKIVEVTNGPRNWGKFLVGCFDEAEWSRRSELPDVPASNTPLLRQIGWTQHHLLVLDLQTGEGACFLPSGYAKVDLNKHRVWVCPMYEPFLTWLYAFQKGRADWFADLPAFLDLPDAPFSQFGYRREGVDRPEPIIPPKPSKKKKS